MMRKPRGPSRRHCWIGLPDMESIRGSTGEWLHPQVAEAKLRSLVAGTGHSDSAMIVPRAFFTYSMERPATMKRASSGRE